MRWNRMMWAGLAAWTACAGISAAQPANRPAAFTTAVTTAQAAAPALVFQEAELENDGGVWVVEVKLAALDGASVAEFKYDATSFALRESESKPTSSSKQAELLTWLNLLGTQTVTPAQAIALAAARTPDGTRMQKFEREVESGRLVYQFEFYDAAGVRSRVNVDAANGSTSGGGNPSGPGNGPGTGSITAQQAIAIALQAKPGVVLEVEFENESVSYWKVKIIDSQNVRWEVRVAAVGGQVIDIERKLRSSEDKADDGFRRKGRMRSNVNDTQVILLAQNAAPGSTVVKIEYEYEGSILVAKVTVLDAGGLRTLRFNAWGNGQPVGEPSEPQPDSPPAAVVTVSQAVGTALTATTGSIFFEAELENEGGRSFYKVRTLTTRPTSLRESIVDARTGRLWGTTLIPMSNTYISKANRVVARQQTLSLSLAQLQQIVANQIENGTIVKIEVEPEGSNLNYDVDARVGQRVFRLRVDGRSGVVSPRDN